MNPIHPKLQIPFHMVAADRLIWGHGAPWDVSPIFSTQNYWSGGAAIGENAGDLGREREGKREKTKVIHMPVVSVLNVLRS